MPDSSDFETDVPNLYCNNFHGCYLLRSTNSRFKNKVYVGYCVDPIKRLKQHNSGVFYGGAAKTNYRGPWEMIVFVYSFTNNISALKFEWAWQHPTKSKILKARGKIIQENNLEYHLFILSLLINSASWCRIGLNVRFMSNEVSEVFNKMVTTIPKHIRFGVGNFSDIKTSFSVLHYNEKECSYCESNVEKHQIKMVCQSKGCHTHMHIICASKLAWQKKCNECEKYILPLFYACNKCSEIYYWTDVLISSNSRINY